MEQTEKRETATPRTGTTLVLHIPDIPPDDPFIVAAIADMEERGFECPKGPQQWSPDRAASDSQLSFMSDLARKAGTSADGLYARIKARFHLIAQPELGFSQQAQLLTDEASVIIDGYLTKAAAAQIPALFAAREASFIAVSAEQQEDR